MKIAVFGTGMVGQVIAKRLAGLGHEVTIGTRNVNQTMARTGTDANGNPAFGTWYEQHRETVKLATYADAAKASELIFNCTKGLGSVEALQQAGNDHLGGKIIVDVANPLDFSKGMPPSLSPVNTDSLGELIQRTFPETKVVKTLNTMNCTLMVNPAALPGYHNVFVCGNDAEAKATVVEILKSVGWDDNNIIDLGDITAARATEQLLPIWIRLYVKWKNPMFNFRIVGPINR